MSRSRFRGFTALVLSLVLGPAAVAADPPPAGRPVINEFLASNLSGAEDEDGNSPGWIEIQNPGRTEIDLAGFGLSPDAAEPFAWKLPPVRVPPGGFFRIWASGKNRHAAPIEKLPPGAPAVWDRLLIEAGARWRYLAIGGEGDAIPPGWREREFDDGSFASGPSGFGYADDDDATALPEGTTAVFIRRRFRVDDPARLGQLVLRVDYDDGFVAYLNGKRVASANSPVEHPDTETIASDKHEPGRPECFDLTEHIPALVSGENVLAIAGLNDRPSTDMSLIPELGTFPIIAHASFELDPAGGSITLTAPGGETADSVRYPAQAPDRSYGRAAAERTQWAFFITPTPGRPNTGSSFDEIPRASIGFSPAPGYHDAPLEIEVRPETNLPGLEVRVTTDGSTPDAGSPPVKGRIEASGTTVVRAAGFVGDERATPTFAATYIVGVPPPLPVLSIAMDPDEFLETHANQSARGRQTEKEAYLEIIEPDGRRAVATGVGFRLHGGYGRRGGLETKKSYRLYFRKSRGMPALEYPLIPGAAPGGLDKVVLRANFNDRLGAYHGGAAFIRDEVCRDIYRDMGGLAPRGAWCVVLLNGRPLGLYNPVERIDEEFLAAHRGGKKKDWDLIKTGNEVASGTREAWDDLRRFIAEADLSRPEEYEELGRRVDIENFTAYLILELWSQNEDWPQNNWVAARKRGDGEKWSFLCWDLEWGLGHTPTGYQASSIRTMLAKRSPIRDLFAALIASPAYREYFRKEAARHLEGALRPEKVDEHVTRHRDRIAPVIPHELRTQGHGYAFGAWERNVEVVRNFARRRAKHFARIVESSLDPPEPIHPPADRPALVVSPEGPIVIARGEDGGVEVFRGSAGGGAWTRSRAGKDAGAPAAAGSPAAWLDGSEPRIVYRDGSGSLRELRRQASGDVTWRHEDLSGAARAPAAAGDPQVVLQPEGAMPRIVYRSVSGQVHELRWEGSWRQQSITLAAGGPRAVGDPSICLSAADRTARVAYAGEDGGIHELASPWKPSGSTRGRAWSHTDLAKTGNVTVLQGFLQAIPGSRSRTILVCADGTLQGIEYRSGWRLEPGLSSAGAPPAEGRPHAAASPDGKVRQIVYTTSRGRLVELLGSGESWRAELVRAAAVAPAGDPACATDGRTRRIAYRGADGHIHLLTHDGRWRAEDLSAVTRD